MPDQGALQLLHTLPWEPGAANVAFAARSGMAGAAMTDLDTTTRLWAMQLALVAPADICAAASSGIAGWMRALLVLPGDAAAHKLPVGAAE